MAECDDRDVLGDNNRMTEAPDVLATNAARDFAVALAARWQARLGDALLGVTLIGSLAHGGFSRRYSDRALSPPCIAVHGHSDSPLRHKDFLTPPSILVFSRPRPYIPQTYANGAGV